MTSAHLDDAARLERECFSHPWSRQSLQEGLESPGSVFLAAVEDGKLIGYAGMSVVIDEAYIFNVAVGEAFRRKGIGSALVRELVTYGKKHNLCFITLEVRQSNSAAISLYGNFGFIKVGERKNYYSDPAEDAVLMTKYFDIT